MDIDGRIPLEENNILAGNIDCYVVGNIRGMGGSSIVYDGIRQSDGLPVLIKELYPYSKNNAITRHQNCILIDKSSPENIQKQSEKLFNMCKNNAYYEQELLTQFASKFYAYSDISLDFFEQFNTVYTIFQNKDNGCVLSDENKQSFIMYLKYTKRLLEALEPLHNAGYIHLDISPDNIYKTKIDKDEPILRLIDFNSSVAVEDIGLIKYISSKSGFAPYEVKAFKKDKISFSSDLYSVTACLFFWLKGRHPNALDTANPLIPEEKEIIFKNLPEKVFTKCNYILKKGLHSNSSKRYQTAKDMLIDIKELIDLHNTNASQTTSLDNLDEQIYFVNNRLKQIEENVSLKSLTKNLFSLKNVLKVAAVLIISVISLLTYNYFINMPAVIEFDDGSIYTGQLKNGLRNGSGLMDWSNGDTYEGEWENDRMHGYGVYVTSDFKYEGEFVANLKEGYGSIYHYENDYYYVGEWRNNNFDGFGELKYDTSEYKGEFKNGLYHGKGDLLIKTDGEKSLCSGDFVNNDFVFGMMTLPNGVSYYGPFENGRLFGEGMVIFADGTIVNGFFYNFTLEGEATITFSDQSIAKAIFQDNTLEDLTYLEDKDKLNDIENANEKLNSYLYRSDE